MYRLFQRASAPEPSNGLPDDVVTNVVQVFALVGEAIAGATHALLSGDRALAKRVVENDVLIDERVNALVAYAEFELMNNNQLTSDARQMLLTLLRTMPEVERNGDLAEHIARRAARGLGQEISPRSRGLIERMGEVATTIWRETADLLSREGTVAEAGAIEYLDDELDDLHVTVIAEAVSGSMGLPVAIELAMVARFYERFGDHAVNLARRVAIESGSSGEPTTRGAD